jgi:hypothetical protein
MKRQFWEAGGVKGHAYSASCELLPFIGAVLLFQHVMEMLSAWIFLSLQGK